jgi:HEAT repeat protein
VQVLARKELQTKDAIPALTELLKHERSWIRVEAAVTLSKMGPETTKLAVPALLAAVPDRTACVTLAVLGPETAKIGRLSPLEPVQVSPPFLG